MHIMSIMLHDVLYSIHIVQYIVNVLEGNFLDDINSIVSFNLKHLRETKKLSLDALSKLSGVSKSMLGQIERGEVNPTISTVWKIANGLKLSPTELMNRPESEYEAVDIKKIEPLIEDNGKYRNYPIVSFDSIRRFEIYYIEIDAGGKLDAEPHPPGTQEFITNLSGELTVTANGETVSINSCGALRFKADTQHSYQNNSEEICRLNMVIYYP